MKVEPSEMVSVDGEQARYHLRIFRFLDVYLTECPFCFSVVPMDSLVRHGMAAHGKILQEPYLVKTD